MLQMNLVLTLSFRVKTLGCVAAFLGIGITIIMGTLHTDVGLLSSQAKS